MRKLIGKVLLWFIKSVQEEPIILSKDAIQRLATVPRIDAKFLEMGGSITDARAYGIFVRRTDG